MHVLILHTSTLSTLPDLERYVLLDHKFSLTIKCKPDVGTLENH